MKKFSNDDRNNLDSVGFDTTTFDEITEQEIRDYFTKENFEFCFGAGEGDDVDFDSFIDAAITETKQEKRGKIMYKPEKIVEDVIQLLTKTMTGEQRKAFGMLLENAYQCGRSDTLKEMIEGLK